MVFQERRNLRDCHKRNERVTEKDCVDEGLDVFLAGLEPQPYRFLHQGQSRVHEDAYFVGDAVPVGFDERPRNQCFRDCEPAYGGGLHLLSSRLLVEDGSCCRACTLIDAYPAISTSANKIEPILASIKSLLHKKASAEQSVRAACIQGRLTTLQTTAHVHETTHHEESMCPVLWTALGPGASRHDQYAKLYRSPTHLLSTTQEGDPSVTRGRRHCCSIGCPTASSVFRTANIGPT